MAPETVESQNVALAHAFSFFRRGGPLPSRGPLNVEHTARTINALCPNREFMTWNAEESAGPDDCD
jgi:hypothetical protein